VKPQTVALIVLGIIAVASIAVMGKDAIPVVTGIGGAIGGFLVDKD